MHNEGHGCHARGVVQRCFIVDDDERFTAVARASLERDGLAVVGTATSAADAVEQIGVLHPDVVLVDVALGPDSGFGLTRRLVDAYPNLLTRIVLISTRKAEDYAELIDDSPAAGFVWKADLSARAVRDAVAATPS